MGRLYIYVYMAYPFFPFSMFVKMLGIKNDFLNIYFSKSGGNCNFFIKTLGLCYNPSVFDKKPHIYFKEMGLLYKATQL